MEQDILAEFRELIAKPNGIILVTGPTGAGKTTTLYSALNELNVISEKIITTEDPVEYDIDGLIQVPINHEIGLTFAAALRSILRQDPDKILVGEIRDLETAQIAVQASLTGHIVFSTLHTNDAPSSITRLRDMGLEPFLITATLEGVLAQRLVRKICVDCRTEFEPSAEMLMELNLRPEDVRGKQFYLRPRLRPLQQQRLQGPPGHLRAARHQRRHPRPDYVGRLDGRAAGRVPPSRNAAPARVGPAGHLQRHHHHRGGGARDGAGRGRLSRSRSAVQGNGVGDCSSRASSLTLALPTERTTERASHGDLQVRGDGHQRRGGERLRRGGQRRRSAAEDPPDGLLRHQDRRGGGGQEGRQEAPAPAAARRARSSPSAASPASSSAPSRASSPRSRTPACRCCAACASSNTR